MYTTWKWFISCHYVYNHHNLLANCLETKRFNSWRLSFYWLGIRTIEIVTQWCQPNLPNLYCCEGQDSTDNKRSKHAFRQYLVPKSHSHLHPSQLPTHIKADDPEPILNQNVYSRLQTATLNLMYVYHPNLHKNPAMLSSCHYSYITTHQLHYNPDPTLYPCARECKDRDWGLTVQHIIPQTFLPENGLG